MRRFWSASTCKMKLLSRRTLASRCPGRTLRSLRCTAHARAGESSAGRWQYLRRIARPSWFDPQRDQGNWIDGFRPRPGELTFEHALPSAFSSGRFAEYIRNVRPSPNFLMGCSLDQTILATAIDAYHRGHQFHVVDDAVLCAPCAKAAGAPAPHHDIVLQILQVFGERVRSEAVITPHPQASSRSALAANSRGGRSSQ